MIYLELQLVRENPLWLSVLCAYQEAHEEFTRQSVEPAAVTKDSAAAADSEDEVESDEEVSGENTSGNSIAAKNRRTVWLPRLTGIEGIDAEELSRTHGRLIAYGLLKCDLADRSAGVVYQLTSTGRQIIARLSSEQEDGHDQAA